MPTHFSRNTLLATCLLASGAAYAAENERPPTKITISATRQATPVEEVGASVTIITAEEIERKQLPTVVEVLRQVPGVDVASNGGLGQTARVFLRGANSNHTLVIIDGVRVNDPSSPDNAFDFSNLTADNIERIEVLRGPQGTLYGSDAIGGVITVTTKHGQGAPSYHASAEAGSHNTYRETAGASGSVDRFHYSAQLARIDSGGISAVNRSTGVFIAGPVPGFKEHDGYANTSFSGNASADLNEIVTLGFTSRYSHANVEYDEAFPLGDAHYKGITREISGRAYADVHLLSGAWDQQIGIGRSEIDRRNQDGFPRESEGTRSKIDWVHHIKLPASHLLTAGLESEDEVFSGRDLFSMSKASAYNRAAFVQDQFNPWDKLFITIGGRLDHHEQFGSETTWRIAPAYTIAATQTLLKASYGTGFKAPSLFNLYDSFFGNRFLQPEESRGYEFGFEQPLWQGRASFGATYFHNRIDDLIDSDPATFRAINVGEARIYGIESFAQVQPLENLSLSAHYTYTSAEDERTGLDLLRRARHKASLDANYRFWERGQIGGDISFTGRREDSRFPGRVTLGSYTLVNLNASWELNDRFTLFGRADNLLDKSYEEVYGFGTPGISLFGGVKARF